MIDRHILISGASGFVGSHLVPYLTEAGYFVHTLVRRQPEKPTEIFWDPYRSILDLSSVSNLYGVINLAGESIAGGRWSPKRKEALYQSRIASTSLLIKNLQQLPNPPKVFITASGVGYYGDRGDTIITESEANGRGFLPELALAWEREARKGNDFMRVILLRFGMILSREGGALAKMLIPFKLGVGGRLGSGRQYMSWVHLKDVLEIIKFILIDEQISGPLNAVSSNPVTNTEFTKTLGKVLDRPTVLNVPAIFLKILLGQMAEDLLLSSTRAVPQRLLEYGYKFNFPELRDAIAAELRSRG